MVRQSWQLNTKGSLMFSFVKKLKAVKNELKPWAKSTFRHVQEKLQQNLDKINYVEAKLINNPASYRLNNWFNRLVKQREKLLLFNQKYWGRLARKEWLVNGDRNSNYFQRRANSRRKNLLITKIKNDVGNWIEDQPTLQ